MNGKTLKRYGWLGALALVVALVFAWAFALPTQAEETNTLTIHFEAGHRFALWHIDGAAPDPEETIAQTPADLTAAYGEPMTTDATDADGVVTVAGLAAGTYIGLTQPADDGVASAPFTVSFDAGQSAHQDVYPKATRVPGGLVIHKLGVRDGQRSPLAGAVFEVYADGENAPLRFDTDGALVTDGVGQTSLATNDDGVIQLSGLLPGLYRVKEIAAPNGYQKADADATVTVRADQTAEVTIENTWENAGRLRFRKLNRQNEPLQGAAFRVLDQNGDAVTRDGKPYEVTSGAGGYFSVSDLPFGTYQLEEIKAPVQDGTVYQLLEQPIRFTLTADAPVDQDVTNIYNDERKGGFLPQTAGTIRLLGVLVGALIALVGGVLLIHGRREADK